MSEPYPFDSDDDIEIKELDLDDLDAFGDKQISVGDLAGNQESWRYGHVIVDEAQDLTDMQWRMIMRRVRSNSVTIVGDLAQRTVGPAGTWADHLPASLGEVQRRDLTINYRSPTEINDLASRVLAELTPDLTPSTAIRSSGLVPVFESVTDVTEAVGAAVDRLSVQVGGQVAAIGVGMSAHEPLDAGHDARVRWLEPRVAKGLEFDGVVVVEPADIASLHAGLAHLYIALTRATQQLVVLHSKDLPSVLLPSV